MHAELASVDAETTFDSYFQNIQVIMLTCPCNVDTLHVHVVKLGLIVVCIFFCS